MSHLLEQFNKAVAHVRELSSGETFAAEVDVILRRVADEVADNLNKQSATDLYVTIGEIKKSDFGLTPIAFVGSNLTSNREHVGEAIAGNIEGNGFREMYWPTRIRDVFVQRTDHGRTSPLIATYALVGRRYVVFNR